MGLFMKNNIAYAIEYFHMANDSYNRGMYEIAVNRWIKLANAT
jgi:hypothetical protein